jgi:hypothetical protein
MCSHGMKLVVAAAVVMTGDSEGRQEKSEIL